MRLLKKLFSSPRRALRKFCASPDFQNFLVEQLRSETAFSTVGTTDSVRIDRAHPIANYYQNQSKSANSTLRASFFRNLRLRDQTAPALLLRQLSTRALRKNPKTLRARTDFLRSQNIDEKSPEISAALHALPATPPQTPDFFVAFLRNLENFFASRLQAHARASMPATELQHDIATLFSALRNSFPQDFSPNFPETFPETFPEKSHPNFPQKIPEKNEQNFPQNSTPEFPPQNSWNSTPQNSPKNLQKFSSPSPALQFFAGKFLLDLLGNESFRRNTRTILPQFPGKILATLANTRNFLQHKNEIPHRSQRALASKFDTDLATVSTVLNSEISVSVPLLNTPTQSDAGLFFDGEILLRRNDGSTTTIFFEYHPFHLATAVLAEFLTQL